MKDFDLFNVIAKFSFLVDEKHHYEKRFPCSERFVFEKREYAF